VGDSGRLRTADDATVPVSDAIVAAGYVLHVAEAGAAPLAVGDKVTVCVDYERRGQIVPNHTLTHVLNWALREVLGEHVDQKGSIVLPDKWVSTWPNVQQR
jgi:alanyl-tRNA synthetase